MSIIRGGTGEPPKWILSYHIVYFLLFILVIICSPIYIMYKYLLKYELGKIWKQNFTRSLFKTNYSTRKMEDLLRYEFKEFIFS